MYKQCCPYIIFKMLKTKTKLYQRSLWTTPYVKSWFYSNHCHVQTFYFHFHVIVLLTIPLDKLPRAHIHWENRTLVTNQLLVQKSWKNFRLFFGINDSKIITYWDFLTFDWISYLLWIFLHFRFRNRIGWTYQKWASLPIKL